MVNQTISRKFKLYSLKIIAGLLLAFPLAGQTSPVPRFVEEFVKGFLALSPSTATSQGYHEHHGVSLDEKLDDYSASGMSAARAFAQTELAEAEKLEHSRVSPEDRADLEVVRLQCEGLLLEIDRIQNYHHNPTVYVEMLGNAIYTPLVLDYAPEPVRMRQIVARIEKLPRVLEEARRNLTTAPEIWVRVAEQENAGNISLIDHEVRAKMPGALKTRFDAAAGTAIEALKDFNQYLETDLLKRPSDWRLGKDLYAAKFNLTLTTGNTPETTLEAAEKELQDIREDMRKQAEVVFPKFFPGKTAPRDLNALVSQVLDKVAQQHTTPEHYFDDAKHDLAETTAFVREKRLLTVPAGGNLQVIPTPEFMRGIYGVGGFSPAPVLEPRLGAFYWITPFTSDMTAARVESKLREYNTWGLKILTIHEAMPGHYVQAGYAAEVQPKWRGALRAIFGNGPYVEGWAVYATQLMIDTGYENNPEMRLTFGKQMLRVVANTILDIRLQTMGMTDQQALDLMIRDTFQEREEAEKKLQRAKLSSCQLPTYFVGWRGWKQVRAAEEKKQGRAFSLPEFHEWALKEGAVPLPVLAGLAGGAPQSTGDAARREAQ